MERIVDLAARGVDRVADDAPSVVLTGRDPQAVFTVLRDRVRSNQRADGHRLGLVVEGGGMRGVYTAAGLLALHALGASALFDDVFATSAGAMNAAYFLTGHGQHGADGYYAVLADRAFIDFFRIWRPVDIDFVMSELLVRRRPLDLASLLRSPTRFHVPVANFADGTPHLIDVKSDAYEPLTVLHAAIALPVYYNRTVQLGPLRAFDAGLCNPLPLRDAVTTGCTHILVLTTRPHDHVATLPPRWQRAVFDARFAQGNQALNAMFREAFRVSNALRKESNGGAPPDPRSPGPALATISPRTEAVGDFTQDKPLLRRTLLACSKGAIRTIGGAETSVSRIERWAAEGIL